jgi:hypothetical protein
MSGRGRPRTEWIVQGKRCREERMRLEDSR